MRTTRAFIAFCLALQLSLGPIIAQAPGFGAGAGQTGFQTQVAGSTVRNVRVTSQSEDGSEVVLTMDYTYDGLGGEVAVLAPLFDKRDQKGVGAWFGSDPVTINRGRGIISVKAKFFNDEPGVPAEITTDRIYMLVMNPTKSQLLTRIPVLRTIKWGNAAGPARLASASAGQPPAATAPSSEDLRLAEAKLQEEQRRVLAEQQRLAQEARAAQADAAARDQARLAAEAEAKLRAEAQAKAEKEATDRELARQKAEAEAKRLEQERQVAEAKRLEDERKRQAELTRIAAEQKRAVEAKLLAEAQAKKEAEERRVAQLKAEAEEKARKAAEEQARQEALAKQAAEQKAAEETRKLAEQKRLAEEAARQAREQAEKDRLAAEARKKEIERQQAEATQKRLAEEKRIAEAKAKKEADERKIAQQKAEAEAKARADAEARAAKEAADRVLAQKRAEQEALRVEQERKLAEAKRLEEERQRAAQQAKLQEEQARLAEAKRVAQAKARAEAEERRLAQAKAEADEKARQQAEATARAEAAARQLAQQKAEAEAQRLAQEKAAAEAQQAKAAAAPQAQSAAPILLASAASDISLDLAAGLRSQISNVDVVNRSLDRTSMTIGVEYDYRDSLKKPMLGVSVTREATPGVAGYFETTPMELPRNRRNFMLFPVKFQPPTGLGAEASAFTTDKVLVFLMDQVEGKRLNIALNTMLLLWRAPGAAAPAGRAPLTGNAIEFDDFKQAGPDSGTVTVRYSLAAPSGYLRVRVFDAANPSTASWFNGEELDVRAGRGSQPLAIRLESDSAAPANPFQANTILIELLDDNDRVLAKATRTSTMTWRKPSP